jgi:adenylate cyclase
LYLQGSYFAGRGTSADQRKARDYLEQSVQLDPEFASAWAELSRVAVGSFGGPRKDESESAKRLALDAARKALALDPLLPEAHIAMGKFAFYVDWNWSGAYTEFRKALELAPDNAPTAFASILWIDTPGPSGFEKESRGPKACVASQFRC